MTIKEILEKLDDFKGKEREKYLRSLFDNLTPFSQNQLRNFQDTWDGNKSFEEFVKAQNKEIRMCIEMELSEIGKITRKAIDLQPLNENDEIK